MSDIGDQAADAADIFLRAALSNQKQAANPATIGIGCCLFCAADVDDNKRWCDSECRDLWQAEQRRK